MELRLDADIDGFMAEIAAADQQLVMGVRDAVDTACKAGAAEAKRNHKFQRRSGELEDGISGQQISSSARGAKGEVVSTSAHSGYVNDGTPAHMIYPKAAAGTMGPLPAGQSRGRGKGRRALAFEVGGEMVFAAKVSHPGTTADPFFDRGVAETDRVLTAEVDKVIAKVAGG